MVAKFLDGNKPKRHLKKNTHCFKLHRSYLISCLSSVGEILWVESERRVTKFIKNKIKSLRCAHLIHKGGA